MCECVCGSVVSKLRGYLLTARTVRAASDRVFDKFDRDGSGRLERGEIQEAVNQVWSRLGMQTPDIAGGQFLMLWDADRSGDIDRDELYNVVVKTLAKAGVQI
mmetsp:Transcript_50021/g.112379  ORF Transcript_50021/g.112379 Transcript_50021/m.112379 type:complete len:103 (+) Transcript_50021:54-362(+)